LNLLTFWVLPIWGMGRKSLGAKSSE